MSKSHPNPVIDALNMGDYKVVEQYVKEDNINVVDKDGYSLLSRAATATDLNMRIVRLLVKRGADVNIRLREGWTLLRAGCDPNAVDAVGQTALTKVLWTFNPKADLVEILLEHWADAEAKHGDGESAIEIASRTGQINLFPAR